MTNQPLNGGCAMPLYKKGAENTEPVMEVFELDDVRSAVLYLVQLNNDALASGTISPGQHLYFHTAIQSAFPVFSQERDECDTAKGGYCMCERKEDEQ